MFFWPRCRPTTSTLIHSFGMWERSQEQQHKQAPLLSSPPPPPRSKLQQAAQTMVVTETPQRTNHTMLRMSRTVCWLFWAARQVIAFLGR